MDRRNFIKNVIRATGALSLGAFLPGLMNFTTGKASAHSLFAPNLHIQNNSFTFAELEGRDATNRIIIHHSGISGSPDITAKDIDAMHKANGWSGIGYHMFVRKNGLIETGRPLDDVGAHTFHYNMDSIGICLHGNFNDEYPTEYQLSSLNGLVALLCQMYALKPNISTIKGHRDYNATACPGDNLYADLGKLRESAARLV